MNINYEVLCWVLVAFIIGSFCLIVKLIGKINELSSELNTYSQVIRNDIDCIRADLASTSELVSELQRTYEVELDKKPDPEEDNCERICGEETTEDPIHLISQNEYFFESWKEKFDLEYFEEVDEVRYYHFNDEYIVIDNVSECIGDGLKFFGVNSKDPNVVYVRNNVFAADFRIVKRSINDD